MGDKSNASTAQVMKREAGFQRGETATIILYSYGSL